jgi:hypothetical protein
MNRKMQMFALAIVVFTIVMALVIFATHSYGEPGWCKNAGTPGEWPCTNGLPQDPYIPAPQVQPACTTTPVTINGVQRLVTMCCFNGVCQVR